MELPTPKQIKQKMPLKGESKGFVEESRQTLRRILAGKDKRMALVIGPCSIHDLKSCREYAKRFKVLAEEVEETCFLVMRTYLQKPRTVTGWKGLFYDPHLDGSNDICTGVLWSREFLLELAHLQVPAATEFLDPLAAPFFDDLISWGFIGARTSASQPHRELASLLSMPIGFKNGTDGNVDQAIHGVISARSPHTFLHMNEKGSLLIAQSEGNPYTHVVLRGSCELPNYDEPSVQLTLKKMHALGLKSRLLIDCSHGNSQKIYLRQKEAFDAVLEQILEGNKEIMGMMLESHLEAGSQFLSEDPSSLKFAVSVTDPCMDWPTTEELVRSSESRLMKFN